MRPIKVDLADIGLESGGDLLLRRALRGIAAGECVEVSGTHPELVLQLRAWCRLRGHVLESGGAERAVVRVGVDGLAVPTERAGAAPVAGVVERPPSTWGLAARGADVERGAPAFDFGLVEKTELWTDDAARLYARAAAAQWDPEQAIDWAAPIEHDEEVEDAVVQVMTYLIENETAALLVPARFLGKIHPHFREVMQLLAVQAADEARHIEVFTRRALLKRSALALSTVGGQSSLKTLLDEPDFALASFLLSVMGEGSFLVLLKFLQRFGPDPVTAAVARLAAQDEARHVAFGLAHLGRHAAEDPSLLPRLASAMQRRHAELAETAGLNERVFDSLAIIAAGGFAPRQIAAGYAHVAELQADMEGARRGSLIRLGFAAAEATRLSGLHTRNFM